jgi:hypothetical protein
LPQARVHREDVADLLPAQYLRVRRAAHNTFQKTGQILLVLRETVVADAASRDSRQVIRKGLIQQNPRWYMVTSFGDSTAVNTYTRLPDIADRFHLLHDLPPPPLFVNVLATQVVDATPIAYLKRPDNICVLLPTTRGDTTAIGRSSLPANLEYNEFMRKPTMQLTGHAENQSLYVPGSQGRFITSHELSEWWRNCMCPGQAPALEIGDRWFIDPPMMWEARGETILKRTLHVLPPLLWRHLN